MQAEKDMFGRYAAYASPNASSIEPVVVGLLNAFADSVLNGKTAEEQRALLTDAPKANDLITAFVMDNLPDGIGSIDGKTVRPLLRVVIAERVALLPDPGE